MDNLLIEYARLKKSHEMTAASLTAVRKSMQNVETELQHLLLASNRTKFINNQFAIELVQVTSKPPLESKRKDLENLLGSDLTENVCNLLVSNKRRSAPTTRLKLVIKPVKAAR